MKHITFKTISFVLIISILFATGIFAEEEKNERVVKMLIFDPDTATVSYELTHPAKIRIRIGAKEGPLFRTIVDWQERGIGLHKENWDGMDPAGKIKLVGNHELIFTFNYFTEDDAFLKNVSAEDILPHPEQVIIGRFLPTLDINRIHKAHSPAYCYDPQLNIKLPKATRLTKDGYPIIKDKTQLTVDIPQKDKSWFSRERYSIHIFLDDIFLTGELEGYSPYNFLFDPVNLNKGKHLITVNYSGFNDHIAIASLPIFIEKKGDKIAKAE